MNKQDIDRVQLGFQFIQAKVCNHRDIPKENQNKQQSPQMPFRVVNMRRVTTKKEQRGKLNRKRKLQKNKIDR